MSHDIKELSRAELERWCLDNGHKVFRSRQILRWVYRCGTDTFADMSDVSAALRERLAVIFSIDRLSCVQTAAAADGTCKYVFALPMGGGSRACRFLPQADKPCASRPRSDVRWGVQFCATARMRPVRNLSAGEILAQVWEVQHALSPDTTLTNVVFMGMGEPLANYGQVVKAIETLTAEWELNFSPRQVTVSTVGLVPQMRRLLHETQVNLTVSLSATTDELRTRLMPVNSRYPLEHLLAVCRSLPARSRRRLTCAYTMLAGVNDAPADARRLTRLLHGIRAKVNLIPFNAFSGSGFTASPRPHIDRFRQLLLEKGVLATIRESRGRDVLAACGQLATHGETIA